MISHILFFKKLCLVEPISQMFIMECVAELIADNLRVAYCRVDIGM